MQGISTFYVLRMAAQDFPLSRGFFLLQIKSYKLISLKIQKEPVQARFGSKELKSKLVEIAVTGRDKTEILGLF